jgi:galactokinase
MNLFEQVKDQFRATFHTEPTAVARAPGRVNLLGEHIDYNGGWVLPAAIDRATYVAFAPAAAETVTLRALDLNESDSFSLTDLQARRATLKSWAQYPAGVAWALQGRGLPVKGLQAVYASDVPRGAGLSSSASVEVAFATVWQTLGGWALEPMDKARLCQKAENEYVGVNCGIMDQFASACGQAEHALLLDCRSLDWERVALPAGLAVVVADTGVRRELGKSEYNIRRAQCEAAVAVLAGPLPGIRQLRDVSVADFNRHAGLLSPLEEKRARHVVEECARTQAAVGLLQAGRAAEFGQLMNACHASLRDLYEVSCPELNAMAEAAQTIEGCYGARLTGAGFGGCTVNLVAETAASHFNQELAQRYLKATGQHAEIYVCRAADGAGIL